ncbi:MAG: TIGR03943 family protein [Eubacteriales bacterium]|jgi:putative membrane protein
MYAQKRVLNPQVFLEFVCYVTFAVLMLYLVFTGKYQSYVTPRIAPYSYFTAAVMLIWALGSFPLLFRPQHKIRAAHCLVLAVPVMLLLLPHTPVNTADIASGYLNGNTPGQSSAGFNASTGAPDTSAPGSSTADSSDAAVPGAKPGAQDDAQKDASAVNLPGLDVKNKKITVSNDDFGLWLSETYKNIEKYKGYTVIMTGFVVKNPEMMAEDEFVPARLMMTCCVADLAPAGLLCKYDRAPELKEGSWVTAEGILYIGKVKYEGMEYDEPQISVTKITPAGKVDGYVYPY